MTTLFIVVEGWTEEQIVKTVLVPHLARFGVYAVPIIVTTSRQAGSGKKYKGGGRWAHWHNDLRKLAREHHRADVRFTTLFDLYGLPIDFPGYAKAPGDVDTAARAKRLEAAMSAAVGDRRLIPYIQRHEVEALVLVDLEPLAALVGTGSKTRGVQGLRQDLGALSPEEVNDGPHTAPSKRLERFVAGYQKTVHGPLVIEATGLPRLRAACPRFDHWVTTLEALGTPPALADVASADTPPITADEGI